MYKIVIKNEADGQLLWVGRIKKLNQINQLLASFEKDDAPDPETATKEAEAEYRRELLGYK